MVRAGELGEIRKVVVEYNQGWLATQLEASGNKQAAMAHRPGAEAAWPGRSATSARTPRTCCRTVTGLRDGEPLRRPARASCPAARWTTTPACCCAIRRRARRADRLADRDRRRERLAPAGLRHPGLAGVAAGGAEPPAAQPDGWPARAADARLAVAVRGGAPRQPPAARATRRVSSRHLPMSTLGIAAAIRAHGSGHAGRPAGCRLSRRSRTARVACVSSRRSWRRRPAI